MQPLYEVAGVLNAHWPAVQGSAKFNTWQLRTLNAIRRCRSAALGAHVDGCTSCGHLRISYNSCRNRHCPKPDKPELNRKTFNFPILWNHLLKDIAKKSAAYLVVTTA